MTRLTPRKAEAVINALGKLLDCDDAVADEVLDGQTRDDIGYLIDKLDRVVSS